MCHKPLWNGPITEPKIISSVRSTHCVPVCSYFCRENKIFFYIVKWASPSCGQLSLSCGHCKTLILSVLMRNIYSRHRDGLLLLGKVDGRAWFISLKERIDKDALQIVFKMLGTRGWKEKWETSKLGLTAAAATSTWQRAAECTPRLRLILKTPLSLPWSERLKEGAYLSGSALHLML